MNAIIKAPLTGELLPPGEMLCVSAAMHPFRTAAETVMVPAGSSVAEIVEVCQRQCATSRFAIGADVTIAGHLIPRDLWSKVRVKAGAMVLVRAKAGKAFGSIIKAVFTIGLIILGSFLTAGLGLSALTAGLIVGGVGIVGNLLLTALFPPSAAKADQPKTLYSIGAPRNKVGKWEPIPSVLGEVRKAAHYAADAWTYFENDDQYVRLLFVWGMGPLNVSDIRIGKTPITDFDDVELQNFYGYATDGQQTLYPSQVVQDDVQIEITKKDTPIKLRTAEDATEVQFDIYAPGGVADITYSTGKKKTQDLRGYARLLAPGTETIVREVPWDMWDNDTNPKRVTFRIPNLPGNANYDFRLFRTTKDYDDSDKDESDNVDNITLTALRTFRKAPPINFPLPLAITAMRIRATKQLSGVPDDVTALVRTKTRKWNGAAWVADQITRNPGDLFRHVLQGPANRRPRTDAQLDLPAIQAFAARCTAKGFTFDMDRDFRASVFETAKDVLAAGRAVPILKDGKWSVAYESATAPIVQHFTPQNSWNMRRKQTFSRKTHALRIKYQDRTREYEENERLVYNDGYTKANATLTEMFELPGITDRDLIHKHARYRLAEVELRPAIYSLNVDAEHLRCNKGDRVYVASDVLMNTLQTGRVKDVSGQVVALSQPVPMADGGSYAIRFRRRDGTSIVRTVVTNPGSQDTVTLSGTGAVPSVPSNRSAGDLFSFGPVGQETGVYRIKEIRSGGDDLSAELDLVDDAPEIERADTQAIPDYDSGLVQPVDLSAIRPKNLAFAEAITGRGIADFSAILSWGVVSLAGVQSFEVAMARAQDAFATVARPVAPDRDWNFGPLDAGPNRFRVRSVLRGGKFTTWSDILSVTAVGTGFVPPDVREFRAAWNGALLVLSWNDENLPILDHEVRFSPRTDAVTWEQMTVLARNAPGLSLTTGVRDGTYAVKARSFGSTMSASAAFATVSGSGLIGKNVVETIDETGTWSGAKSGLTVENGSLRLALGGDVFALADFFAPADFFSPGGQPVFAESGVYEVPGVIDLGAVYTSRVTAALDAHGSTVLVDFFKQTDVFAAKDWFGFDASDWNARVEMQTTLGDLATTGAWGAWAEITAADVEARALRFRIVLESFDLGVTPRVEGASITVDMPDRIAADADLVVPVAGRRITFVPPFAGLDGISIAAQDMASGDRAVITNKSRTGFEIVFRNSAGAAVARTFDYTAKGYGQVTQ